MRIDRKSNILSLTVIAGIAVISVFIFSQHAFSSLWRPLFEDQESPSFKVTLPPDIILDGAAKNIDSPEFFEADIPEESLLLISGKSNDRIEIWRFPFSDMEQPSLKRSSLPNGLAVDQERNLLFVGDSEKQEVELLTLPELKHIRAFGRNRLGSGETNGDILSQSNGRKIFFATEQHQVRGFDIDTGEEVLSFSPNVEDIEEVLADSYHQVLYIPEEKGKNSQMHPGGGIVAYHPDGTKYLKNDSNVFGRGLFDGDGEGITLYRCRTQDNVDTGRGFIIAADQAPGNRNSFEFFDRETWFYLGSLVLKGVSGTDGIASTSLALPGFPRGIFAASNNDTSTALISWEKIFHAARLSCDS